MAKIEGQGPLVNKTNPMDFEGLYTLQQQFLSKCDRNTTSLPYTDCRPNFTYSLNIPIE